MKERQNSDRPSNSAMPIPFAPQNIRQSVNTEILNDNSQKDFFDSTLQQHSQTSISDTQLRSGNFNSQLDPDQLIEMNCRMIK